jgi:hypothetical protein
MRKIWIGIFLTLTAAALGMEIWAAADSSPDTLTWSELIGAYIPQTVAVGAAAILAAWITPHIAAQYRRSKGAVMVEQIPVPPSKEADARNRAFRTFVQQLGIDVVVAVVLAVGPQLIGQNTAWTKDYLTTVAVLAAKTAIATIVAYLARKVVPPQFAPPREVAPVNDPTIPARPVVD